MKKHAAYLLVLCFASFLISCNEEQSKESEVKSDSTSSALEERSMTMSNDSTSTWNNEEPLRTNHLIPPGEARDMIKRFEKEFVKCEDHRKIDHDCKGIKGLSTSVWIDTATLRLMYTQLRSGGGDGLRIYMGAYDRDPVRSIGQWEKIQSTVLMVATKRRNRPNIDKRSIHQDDFNFFRDRTDKKILDVFNHGELCPDSCDVAN